MDRRTRILGGVFGAIALYAFVSAVVYPAWIEPLMTLDERIAERQAVLDTLEEGEAEADRAKQAYRQCLDRIGSFDAVAVENDLRERLNHLIAKHGLEDQNVSPRRPQTDRKTGIEKMIISVNASGTLQSAVAFLEELAELPHLIRVGSAAVYPASSSRRRDGAPERMNLRVPLEAWILPRQPLLGARLTDADLHPPESRVRHAEGDYALIWEREPFTPYVPPKPLVANAGRNMTVDVGASAALEGKAAGGIGEYAYRWQPEEALGDPTSPRPTLADTSKIGEHEFTLTVTDEGGNTSTSTVTVTVREAPQVADSETDPTPDIEPRAPAGPQRWREGKDMRLTMALIRREGDQRQSEFMVFNQTKDETTYHAPGDEFDGGELVYVHPRGAVVRRQDDYFVYPIGAALNEDLPAEDAADYPELQEIASWMRRTPPAPVIDQPADEEVGPTADQPDVAATAPPGAEAKDEEKPPDGKVGEDDTAAVGDKAGEPDEAPAEAGDAAVGPKEASNAPDPAQAEKPKVKQRVPGKRGTRGSKPGAMQKRIGEKPKQ